MKKIILLNIVAVLFLSACNKADEEVYDVDSTSELSQQVGDSMASIDEGSGTTTGTYAVNKLMNTTGFEKTYARLSQDKIFSDPTLFVKKMSNLFQPNANAAACNTVAFSTCASGQKIRNLSGCSVGTTGVMNGTVTLNFSGTGAATCTMPAINDFVSRVPNFSISGLRGANFAVKAVTTGQKIKNIGNINSMTFENTGINRKFTTNSGKVILDVTTSTSAPIAITNAGRNSRTVSGGGITVIDNLTALSCTLNPNVVTWTANCNCPTSGTWSGSCSDSSTLTIAFSNACGVTTVTKGSEIKSVTMDRCQQ